MMLADYHHEPYKHHLERNFHRSNLQDGMSLPGSPTIALAAGGTGSVPSAANSLSQHTGQYMTTNAPLSAPTNHPLQAAYHLNPHATVAASQNALPLSHSQGPTPTSTPPAVPNDTKGPVPYQQYTTMNHQATGMYRTPMTNQTIYSRASNSRPPPLATLPRNSFVMGMYPTSNYVVQIPQPPLNTLNNPGLMSSQVGYPNMSSSNSTDQGNVLYMATPHYPATANYSRSWNPSARTPSQNMVSAVHATPILQNSQQYSTANQVPSIAPQQPHTQMPSQTKKRSHRIPIVDPETMKEVDPVDEEKGESDSKSSSMRTTETLQTNQQDFLTDNNKVAVKPTDGGAPVSVVESVKQSDAATITQSPTEWKSNTTSSVVRNVNHVGDTVDHSALMSATVVATKPSNVPNIVGRVKADYQKPAKDREPQKRQSDESPQVAIAKSSANVSSPQSFAECVAAPPTSIASPSKLSADSSTNLGSLTSTSVESTTTTTTTTTLPASTVPSDGLNKAALVTSNSLVLDDICENVPKKLTKPGLQSGSQMTQTSATSTRDSSPVSFAQMTIGKPNANTASSQSLPLDSNRSSSPAQVYTKNEFKSQPNVPASLVNPPQSAFPLAKRANASATLTAAAEKPSPVLTQSLPTNEPFPAKTSNATGGSSQTGIVVDKTANKDEKFNSSSKKKGKDQGTENASTDLAQKSKSQPQAKHHTTESPKTVNSYATVAVKTTNGESGEQSSAPESKSKKKKNNKKELNKKGSEKEGTDMDLFSNIDKSSAVPAEKIIQTEKLSLDNPAQSLPVNATDRSKSNSSQKSESSDSGNLVNANSKPSPNSQEASSNNERKSKENLDSRNIPAGLPTAMGVQVTDIQKTEDDRCTNNNNAKVGEKKYTVKFMMTLRDEPQCKVAVQLSNLLLQLLNTNSSRNVSQNGFAGGSNFLPNFMPQSSMSLPSRKSQQGNMRRDNSKPIHVSLSLREEVPLKRSKDAWRPAIFNPDTKNMDEETRTTEELYKSARGILNKLTPEKFNVLKDKFSLLNINTEERLKGVISLIFDKAIDEPGFCRWYAGMCCVMQNISTDSGEGKKSKPLTFRTALINKCQFQFDNAKLDEEDVKAQRAKINDCTDLDKKKELILLLEEKERKMRRKSVGNCKFIGELFKMEMLTASIMVKCIEHLIRGDEDCLECLCKLLSTTGKNLEEKNRESVDECFKGLHGIVNSKKNKVSSRVRFMILDVIDLRKSNWIPRREGDNPKTIDQINSEIEKKELDQRMANMTLRKSYDEYAGGGGGGGRNRDFKKNSRNDNASSNEWQTVTHKSQKNFNFKVDTARLMIPNKGQGPETEASLGPPASMMWRQGCVADDKKPTSTGQPMDRSSSVGVGSRMALGGKLTPSASMERKKQYSANRDDGGAAKLRTSSSTRVYPSSRESSVPRPIAHSAPTSAPAQELDNEAVRRFSENILKEYDSFKNADEAVYAFKERFGTEKGKADAMVKFIEIVCENYKLAQSCGKVMAILLSRDVITWPAVVDCLLVYIESEKDMMIDYPKMWQYISQCIAVTVTDVRMPYNEFEAMLVKRKPDAGRSSFFTNLRKKLEEKEAALPPEARLYQFLVDKLDNDDFDNIIKWIDEHIKEHRHNPKIVTALTRAICEILYNKHSSFEGLEGDTSIEDFFLKKLKKFFMKYIENEEKLESLCLGTILEFAKAKQYPGGFLLTVLTAIYETKCLSSDSFQQWKESIKNRESIAMMSLNAFFDDISTRVVCE